MTSPPLHIRCKATRLILDEMTSEISTYTRSPSRWPVINLLLLRGRFMQSFAKHTDCQPSVFDVEHCFAQPATPNSAALAAEHLLYLSAFADFITTLLPKLDRRLCEAVGPEEDPGFKVLWGMMFDACTVFLMFPNPWPKHHIQNSHPVYASLHAIMTYLVPLVCPRSDSVRPWAAPLGRAVTANENRVMLTPVFITFNNLCSSLFTDQARLPLVLGALPHAFVQTLCLLICQRFDAPIPNPALVGSMLGGLTGSLAFCMDVLLVADSQSVILPLRTPAVLEVARRGLAGLRVQKAPQGMLDQVQQLVDTLSSH